MGGADATCWFGPRLLGRCRCRLEIVLGSVIGRAWGSLGLLLGVWTLQHLMKPERNRFEKCDGFCYGKGKTNQSVCEAVNQLMN